MNEHEGRHFQDAAELLGDLPAAFLECAFTDLALPKAKLAASRFNECTFTNCDLSNVDLMNSSLRDCVFESCKLVGINWAALKALHNPTFRSCKLDFSSFRGLKLPHLQCTDCSAKETDFSDAELTEACFSGTVLQDAVFHRASLLKADLRTALKYSIDPIQTRMKGARVTLPEAVSLITALGIEVDL